MVNSLTLLLAPQKKCKTGKGKAKDKSKPTAMIIANKDAVLDETALSQGQSTARYKAFRFRNPALKRYNAFILNGRSHSLPLPVYQYKLAKQRGFAHINCLPVC
jgi:hypothetical protein